MGCVAKKPKKSSGDHEYVTTNEKGEVLETLKVHNSEKPELTGTRKKKTQKDIDDFEMDAPTDKKEVIST